MSSTFRSLQFHNYRLWFFGTIIASTGTWMQRVAQDWLVLTELTDHSAFQVGIVTALQFAPQLFLAPYAGVIADRVNSRHLLQFTQAMQGLLGLALGILVLTDRATITQVYVFAVVGGVMAALEQPVRQVFVSELVPPSSLANAVALNSTAFNIARLIGPAVSGLVIEGVGIGWVFIVNAATFIAPIITLAAMRTSELRQVAHVARGKGQVREGLAYVRGRPDIIVIMIVIGVVSSLGMNFQMTSALMATEVFDRQAGSYGLLGSFMAIGALTGALLAARRAAPRLRMVVISALFYGLFEGAMALAPGYWTYALMAIPTGFAMLTMLTTANAAIQLSTEEYVRGRVMSLYGMVSLGSTLIGSPTIGWVGEVWGARWSVGVGAIASVSIALLVGIWVMRHWNYQLRMHASRHPIELSHPSD